MRNLQNVSTHKPNVLVIYLNQLQINVIKNMDWAVKKVTCSSTFLTFIGWNSDSERKAFIYIQSITMQSDNPKVSQDSAGTAAVFKSNI